MSRLRVPLVLLTSLMLTYDVYSLGARQWASSPTLVQSGMASWYGREENGKRTASGEIFNRHEFTAASRHIPLNSIVRVTNQKNGRSVQVRINDRGPYAHGRVLDLSEAAADSLDMKKSGVAPVKIEMVEPASSEAGTAP
jgi:rare lipoprotein A